MGTMLSLSVEPSRQKKTDRWLFLQHVAFDVVHLEVV